MKYIQVNNQDVIGTPQDLPICWKNITNFYLLSDEELIDHGWYKFIQEPLDLGTYEVLVSWIISIETDTVVRKPIKRNMTQEEIDIKNQSESIRKWSDVRNKRNLLLLSSDWTQLPDTPLTNKSEWQLYRQELRDITKAQSPDEIAWPITPLVILPPPESPSIEPPPFTQEEEYDTDSLENTSV